MPSKVPARLQQGRVLVLSVFGRLLGREIPEAGGAITCLAYAADGREALYYDGSSGEVGLLDVSRDRVVGSFGGIFGAHKQRTSCLAFAPDGLWAL